MTERKSNHDIAIELSCGNQGGFMAALGDAYCRADCSNREALEGAFPGVFNAKLLYEQRVIQALAPLRNLSEATRPVTLDDRGNLVVFVDDLPEMVFNMRGAILLALLDGVAPVPEELL